MIPDPPPPFDFGASELVREQIRDLIRRATAVGYGPATRHALTYIEAQLRTRPRDWGEPSYRLRGLQVTVYRQIYQHLLVAFTVHDRVPMVTLWSVTPTTGHPLAGS